VVEALEAGGVEVVFGVPGTHNLEIYRYLSGYGINHVSPRHEQGAGYAADGYARVSGRPGVCVTTSGPGLTNIATAVATAHADSVPMLVLAPGVPRGHEGADRGWLHELRDQRSMMAAIVDSAVRVDTPEAAAMAIGDALGRFRSGRPRPAYVEIPVDVLDQPWSGSTPLPAPPSQPEQADGGLVAHAAGLLARAERPVVVLGGGSRVAADVVQLLVERLGAPTLTSVNGKGVFAETHPLSLGASLRLPVVQRFLGTADVALLVGTEMADSDLWGGTVAFKGEVIRVDLDSTQLDKNVTPTVRLLGDARTVVTDLMHSLSVANHDRGDRAEEIGRIRAEIRLAAENDGALYRTVHEALVAATGSDVVVAGDSAQVSYLGTAHYWPMGPGDRFLYPTGFATLGYGLPAAIGAKIAAPDRTAVVLVGDGGFLFTAQELVTAAELAINLPVVVMANDGYQEIRDQMIGRGMTPVGVDLPAVDFGALSRACGGQGVRLADVGQLGDAVREALKTPAPTVIELPV